MLSRKAFLGKYWSNLILGLLPFLFVIEAMAHSSTELPEGIEVTLELPKSEALSKDALMLTLLFRNVTESPIRVPSVGTGLDGRIISDFLEIKIDGKRLPYMGRISKFASSGEAVHVVVEAQQTIRRQVNLEWAYQLPRKGSYTIQYTAAARPSNLVNIELLEERQALLPSAKVGFNSCTANQISTINSDLVIAEAITKVAVDDLNQVPESLRASAPRYMEWFGAYTPSRYAEVLETFEAIDSVLRNDQSDYFCRVNTIDEDPMFGCNPNEIAFVFPNSAFNVNLCLFYFDLPARMGNFGSDGRVATIVHELSHFTATGQTDDATRSVRGTVKTHAQTNPQSAVNNAPNFEFFVENMPALAMPKPREPASDIAFITAVLALLDESTESSSGDLILTDSPNRPIPASDSDNGVSATITPNSTETVTGLKVRLEIDHGAMGELEILLTHNETTVKLLNQPRQFGQSFACQGNNINNVLTDDAALGVQSACLNQIPAYTNDREFRPAESLNAFEGLPIAGPWKLQVIDRDSRQVSQTGTLKSWQLIFPSEE